MARPRIRFTPPIVPVRGMPSSDKTTVGTLGSDRREGPEIATQSAAAETILKNWIPVFPGMTKRANADFLRSRQLFVHRVDKVLEGFIHTLSLDLHGRRNFTVFFIKLLGKDPELSNTFNP